MHKVGRELILALETGIDGGTVSVLKKGIQIDYLKGSGKISRSEDLLMLIDALLKKNGLRKIDIGVIAVSDSPGSLTGIRIGQALAKGLADSLSAKVYRTSILRSMATSVNTDGKIVIVISSKKQEIYYIQCEIKNKQIINVSDAAKKVQINEFFEEMKNFTGKTYVMNEELKTVLDEFNEFEKFEGKVLDIKIVEGNFAEILGLSVPDNYSV